MPVSYANSESNRIHHLPKEEEADDPLICAMMHSQPPAVKLKRRKYKPHSISSIAPTLILIIGQNNDLREENELSKLQS